MYTKPIYFLPKAFYQSELFITYQVISFFTSGSEKKKFVVQREKNTTEKPNKLLTKTFESTESKK